MDDYLTKISSIPNISTERILVVIYAIKDCSDNKVILIKEEGDQLHSSTEHVTATHPHFYASLVLV